MDISIVDVRSALTVLEITVFGAIVWWAYSGARKSRFDEAARLPLNDDDMPLERAASINNSTSGLGHE